MKVHEAIVEVSRSYVPGVVRFYAVMTPDPWQDAHDSLEKICILDDAEIVDAACQRFVGECRRLVEQFKSFGHKPSGLTQGDRWALAPITTATAAAQSVKYRQCYQCAATSDLVLESYGPEALQVRIVCREHKGKGAA